MPNWCSNVITVLGPKSEIKQFIAMSRTVPEYYKTYGYEIQNANHFSFHGTVPIPEEIVAQMAPELAKQNAYLQWCMTPEKDREGPEPSSEYDHDKAQLWFDWNTINWGTKWDPEVSLPEIEGDEFCFRFESAWAPPLEWMKTVSAKFPELSFHIWYEETGMSFWGEADAENGNLEDNCQEITKEYLQEHHPEWIEDDEEDTEKKAAESNIE